MALALIRGMSGIVFLLLVPMSTQAQHLTVILLGTGNPIPRLDRFGPSTLVDAGTETLLFDCGRGVAQRLRQLQRPCAALLRFGVNPKAAFWAARGALER
jgi:hypothetical protein